MTDYSVVFMTASSHSEAENIAENLVSDKLAACVNILPGVKSFYWWEDKLCKDDELLLIAKIKTSLFKELEKAVKELHSYDVPEIILLPIEDGANTYLDWIKQVTR
jgi:periplasmic divalent cation tolerance protein